MAGVRRTIFVVVLGVAGCGSCGQEQGAGGEAPQGGAGGVPSVVPMSNVFEEAAAMLRAGRLAEGEALLSRRAAAQRRAHGEASAEHGQALFDLATYRLMAGQDETAAETLRAAVEATRTLDDARQHLTYSMNYGEVLQRSGRLEEAEAELRRSLAGRERYYGSAAGTGFGLEALAGVLVAREKLDEARTLAMRARDILLGEQHPKAAAIAVLLAVIDIAQGRQARLEGLDRVSGDEMAEIRSACENGATLDPLHWAPVLPHVVALARRRHPTEVESLLWTQEEAAAGAENHAVRRDAYVALRDLYSAAGDVDRSVEADLGVAFMDSRLGRTADAERCYRAAVAAERGSAAIRSRAHVELGLFLDQHERSNDARPFLERGVRLAREVTDHAADRYHSLGKALTAWGVYLQHQNEPVAAAVALEEAARFLPPEHPDALVAGSHLRSARARAACDCERELPVVIQELVSSRLRAQLPAASAANLAGVTQNAEGRWRVDWRQPPSPTDAETADRVLRQTLGEISRQTRAHYR